MIRVKRYIWLSLIRTQHRKVYPQILLCTKSTKTLCIMVVLDRNRSYFEPVTRNNICTAPCRWPHPLPSAPPFLLTQNLCASTVWCNQKCTIGSRGLINSVPDLSNVLTPHSLVLVGSTGDVSIGWSKSNQLYLFQVVGWSSSVGWESESLLMS